MPGLASGTEQQAEWIARVLGVSLPREPEPRNLAVESESEEQVSEDLSPDELSPDELSPDELSPDELPPSDAGPPPQLSGLADWSRARAQAIADLRAMEAAIADFEFEDSDGAIILLRAIRANLTEEPETLQQVAELERYIGTDDIIASAEGDNGFGIQLRLRVPLMTALAHLRADLTEAAKATEGRQ